MFGSCGGFRFGVRIIYGTAVCSLNLSLKRRLVSPIYCKLQRLH